MGWKETRVQDERLRFVQEVLTREDAMAAVCRRFGVSRKTGYKWLDRFAQQGVAGLADQSKAPKRQAQAFPAEIEREILALRARYPTWGEDKLKARLERTNPDINWPAHSTIGALLKRHGLTHPGKRRRHATPSSKLTSAKAPNQVWAIDFKGWFDTGDGKRCDPLTISDTASRYLLRCQRVARSDTAHVRPLMEATFREYGLPTRILSDNGPPFASTGLAGLSRLSVWWIRLGIQLQRIDPGHPEQNGRHERMHRTLKAETATPPERNLRAQQRAFDRFRQIYNQERPHESLAMATPASVYQPSWRPYPERLPELEYPDRMLPRRVQSKGDIGLLGRQLFLSETLAGETVGLEEHEHGWAVWFGPLELDWLERSLFEGPRPGRGEHRLRRKRSGGASSARPTGSLPRRPPSVSGKDFVQRTFSWFNP